MTAHFISKFSSTTTASDIHSVPRQADVLFKKTHGADDAFTITPFTEAGFVWFENTVAGASIERSSGFIPYVQHRCKDEGEFLQLVSSSESAGMIVALQQF